MTIQWPIELMNGIITVMTLLFCLFRRPVLMSAMLFW